MRELIQARLRQLQTERQQVAGRVQQLATELEHGRHSLSAYDGAIGELSALLATPSQPEGAQDAPEAAAAE